MISNNDLPRGFLERRTTIWLGSDDGLPGGMEGYGFQVTREDNAVMITVLSGDGKETAEIIIHRDLWPKIRRVMDKVNARFLVEDRNGRRLCLRTGFPLK